MKEHLVRVSKNNKAGILKQFKQVDGMHQEILALSAMILLLEQKRALSTSVSSSSENGNYADVPCTREATQFGY